MAPECLPEAQRGLLVEGAALRDGALEVITTGAQLRLDLATGSCTFRQRIGHPREVLQLHITGGVKAAPLITHAGPGLAFARFTSPRFDLRANGDSLFMLHAHEPLQLTVARSIETGFFSSYKAHHVLFDEWGGFGLYCSQAEIDDRFDPFAPVTARYDLPADAVLWIAICPPKPYDWEKSVRDQVVWHWSNKQAYPPDEALTAWAAQGNIVLLQSEVMLWNDWNLAFEPRNGPAEFARVREATRRLGTRFIVYTSPYYFLRGTNKQSAAMNSFENFTNWPSGTAQGENIDLFLVEIARVMRVYRPDGLYFDGQYLENPAALYLLARRARAIVGEQGILEWHSTNALGPELCSLPAADAYVDFILRGEGRDALFGDDRYLRYFVSGYNVHNSIGVICNNTRPPTADFVQRLVAVNGRMHALAGWLNDAKLTALLGDYRALLTDAGALRARVDTGVDQRQSRLPGQVAAQMAEHRALATDPAWDEPCLRERWPTLDGWRTVVSPLNPQALAATPDGLQITAKAHAFAFAERLMERPLRGFEVKIRRGTDGGMSWGPGVFLHWSDGRFLRVGLRSDGLVQADISGDQRVAGLPGDRLFTRPDEWIWLRARWLDRSGTIECSFDGRTFTRVWSFEHGGTFLPPVGRVAVGKVPYNGRPDDHPQAGDSGTCTIGSVEFY